MKPIIITSVAIILALLVLGQNTQKNTKDITAYVIKVIRDVNMRAPASGWQKAVPLSQLKSGYEVKTEKGSLAMILFADQSKLIVREKSIVTIQGEVQGRQIVNRNVHMDRGNIIFNVKKAETEQFRFSSPISVASIRGTEGGYNTGGNEDNLIITEGLAEFTNLLSGRAMNVGTGQKGIADSTGKLDVATATEEELNDIRSGQDVRDEQQQKDEEVELTGTIRFVPSPVAGKPTAVVLEVQSQKESIGSAVLFYKTSEEKQFTTLQLAIENNRARGEIPGSHVQPPALEYYAVITLGRTVVTIPQEGASAPMSVKVVSELSSGNIAATPFVLPQPARRFEPLNVSLEISKGEIQKVHIFYRRGGDNEYKNIELTVKNRKAQGTIPALDVQPPSVEYFFVLSDTGGQEIYLPETGASTPLVVTVSGEARINVEFSRLKSGNDGFVRVNLSSFPGKVKSAMLFHRKFGDVQFNELPLTISGRQAASKIEAKYIKYPRFEYYVQFVLENNTVVVIPERGEEVPATIGVEPIKRVVRIPGQTGGLQKRVLVLKWDE
ncbi:MAG: FecR family protein [Bacteroidetes bacterium]|nr:FecR family protein [Bacteroidota bacterium]